MKLKDKYRIIANEPINNNNIYEMVLEGNTSAIENPGEFVNMTVPGMYLPRPFSIADYDSRNIWLVYKVVGEGTEIMSQMRENEEVDLLTGLGNGFDLTVSTKKPVLIGGGTGVAPLRCLAKALKQKDAEPIIIAGFKNYDDMFYYHEHFERQYESYLTLEQDDHLEYGIRVTDILQKLDPNDYDYFYACGPKPMLKAVSELALTEGEVSLESRMACGIGQCKCCSIETNDGMKTLCKDGPVLKKSMVRW